MWSCSPTPCIACYRSTAGGELSFAPAPIASPRFGWAGGSTPGSSSARSHRVTGWALAAFACCPSLRGRRRFAAYRRPVLPRADRNRCRRSRRMPSPERRGSTRRVVLVLDGYTNQALAIVRSLGRAGYRVLVGSQRCAPLAAWSRYAEGRVRHDGETREAFSKLRRWAVTRDVQVVLPLTERSCLLCNADRADWEGAGITVGCPPDDILMRAFDKASTLEYAAECGIDAPLTRIPDSAEDCRAAAEEIGYPCVIKPRFSNAWDGQTFLPERGPAYVGNPAELDEVVMAWKQREHW